MTFGRSTARVVCAAAVAASVAVSCGSPEARPDVLPLVTSAQSGASPEPGVGSTMPPDDDGSSGARGAVGDVCAMVSPATAKLFVGTAIAGSPSTGSCRWTSGGASISVSVRPVVELRRMLEQFQESHQVTEAPAGVGDAALLWHDGARWGVAFAESGLWVELSGAADRHAALADAAALAHDVQRPKG